MNTYVRKAWRLSWLLMLALQCFADTLRVEQAEPRLDVTVYVFNYAEVPGGTLARAQAVAARIFREVGVKLAWSHAPVSAADTARGVHPEAHRCRFENTPPLDGRVSRLAP